MQKKEPKGFFYFEEIFCLESFKFNMALKTRVRAYCNLKALSSAPLYIEFAATISLLDREGLDNVTTGNINCGVSPLFDIRELLALCKVIIKSKVIKNWVIPMTNPKIAEEPLK